MKKLLVFLFALSLALPAFATNKSVTNVSASASTILTPSNSCQIVVIQNTGAGDVRLGLDGGTTNKQKSTPDPTASTGYLLEAGAQLILTFPGNSQSQTIPSIRAILTSGTTTTLAVSTNDPYST
jgi:hypothetical protein